MPRLSGRVFEKTLSHLSNTLERAGQQDRNAAQAKPLQVIDPRVKMIGAVLLTVAMVSSRSLEILIAFLAVFATLALVSNISWQRLIATWASGLFFAAVIAVPAIFTSGAKLALLLVLRSEASLTCWLLVVMTTPFNRVLRALRSLRLPVVFVAILSMTFRYIFLLVESAQDMLLSRRSRIVGRLSGHENRKVLVSTAGVLLGKSIQMSDDVYHAMISRGFRGDVHLMDDFHMQPRDWVALAAVVAVSGAAFMAGR